MNMISDEYFFEKLSDMTDKCLKYSSPVFSKFLDRKAQRLALEYFNARSNFLINFCFGGFPNSQRNVVGIFPLEVYEYFAQDNEYFKTMFDISCFKIKFSGFRDICHRDVLGSILSLGIKRENIGDIYVDKENLSCYVSCKRSVADFLLTSLEYISRERVKVEEIPYTLMPEIVSEYIVITDTVSSMRLDSVLSVALKMSREKAKRLIDMKSVSVNHELCLKSDFQIEEFDTLSVRGFGRFEVASASDITRKGRIKIEIHKMM